MTSPPIEFTQYPTHTPDLAISYPLPWTKRCIFYTLLLGAVEHKQAALP